MMTTEDPAPTEVAAPKEGDSWWGYVKIAANGRVILRVNRRIADDRRHQLDDQVEDRTAEDASRAGEFEPWQVEQKLADLTPDERDVVTRKYFKQQTYKQIAQELGIPVSRVKNLHHSALKRIRVWLKIPCWTEDLEEWKFKARYRQRSWESLLKELRDEQKRIIDLVEQGQSPTQIALELRVSQEEANELWSGIGSILLQAIDR
jgi:FixJ family two-component response regulator